MSEPRPTPEDTRMGLLTLVWGVAVLALALPLSIILWRAAL